MNKKQALKLAKKITEISTRGMWYDGTESSTNLVDWLMEGATSDMSITELAAEWDE
jgi:hypothetical protein